MPWRAALVQLLLDPAVIMSITTRRSNRRRSAGSTFIEAAVALPLLAVLILSIIDVGMMVGIQLALQHGVSQASRYGATGRTRTSLTREASILAELQAAAPSITIAPGDLTFTNLSHASTTGAGGPTDLMMMTVRHDWTLVSPLLRAFFTGGKATIRASASVTNEPFSS